MCCGSPGTCKECPACSSAPLPLLIITALGKNGILSAKANNPRNNLHYSQSQSTTGSTPEASLGFNLIHRAPSWGKERIQLRQAVHSPPFLIRLLKKPVENVGTRKVGSFSSRIHPQSHPWPASGAPLRAEPFLRDVSQVHQPPSASKVTLELQKWGFHPFLSVQVPPLAAAGGPYCNSWNGSTQPLCSPSQPLSKVSVCQQKQFFKVFSVKELFILVLGFWGGTALGSRGWGSTVPLLVLPSPGCPLHPSHTRGLGAWRQPLPAPGLGITQQGLLWGSCARPEGLRCLCGEGRARGGGRKQESTWIGRGFRAGRGPGKGQALNPACSFNLASDLKRPLKAW